MDGYELIQKMKLYYDLKNYEYPFIVICSAHIDE